MISGFLSYGVQWRTMALKDNLSGEQASFDE
jgi:hypothetical protein